MPNELLASCVPAIDWNRRSTGAPCSRADSCVVMWARQQACVGTSRAEITPSSERRICPTTSTDSVAGLTPMTASPQPYNNPSSVESRMPSTSSLG